MAPIKLLQAPSSPSVTLVTSDDLKGYSLPWWRPSDVDGLKDDEFAVRGPRVVITTTLRFFMSYDPAFLTSRLQFREALVLAMDLPSIVRAVYPPEAAAVPNGAPLFTPLSDGYDPELPTYPYRPDRAREPVGQSGYDGETVRLLSIAAYGLTEMPQLNDLIAEYWRQSGIDVEIIQTDFSHVLARYRPRPQEFDDLAPVPVFHGAFPNRPDGLSTIRRYMTTVPGGKLGYHDPDKGDRIYTAVSALADPQDRDRRLRELNRELYEEYWAADIAWRHEVYGLSSEVTGWQPTDGTSSDLHLETVRPAR